MSDSDMKYPNSPIPGMDPNMLATWAEALRNGGYAQTTEALCDNGGYCCLGVLIDVAFEDEWDEWDDENQRGVFCYPLDERCPEADYDVHHSKNYGELPWHIREAAGISPAVADQLMGFNDTERWSFDQIADWIEDGTVPADYDEETSHV